MEFVSKIWKPFQRSMTRPWTKSFKNKSQDDEKNKSGLEEILDKEVIPVPVNKDKPKSTSQPLIRLTGNGLVEGFVKVNNLIIVQYDITEVGAPSPSPVSFVFDGPSKAEVDFQYKEGKTFQLIYVTYQVSEPGLYTINVGYVDKLIKGSPFRVQIRGLEDIERALQVPVQGKALSKLTEGVVAEFKVSTKYSGEGKLNCTINGPSTVMMSIVRIGKFCYKVSFTPTRPGYYFINLKFNGVHIKGSPFRASCHCICAQPAHAPELPRDDGLTSRRPWIFV